MMESFRQSDDSYERVTADQERLGRLGHGIVNNIPFCPITPNPGPQTTFLLDFGEEALYGGSAGGGKSYALMMAASMFLHVPGYAALLVRKSYSDLTKPGALMDIGEQWWGGKPGCRFDTQENAWFFDCPDGGKSRIVFGYLDKAQDKYKYQGGAYHFQGWDEITHQKQKDYEYVAYSRNRQPVDGPLGKVPLRIRATANPGGTGHKWVYEHFVSPWERWKRGGPRPEVNFYPALLKDNPKLNAESYTRSLNKLDPITRAQLLKGDWNIRPEARMFKRDWFKPISRHEIPGNCAWVRFWDMASTAADPAKDEVRGGPDWTVGVLMGRHYDGRLIIADVRRWRQDPGTNDMMCRATCLHDTMRVAQVVEQEGGSSGKVAVHHYRNGAFVGQNFRGFPSTGSKVVRAGPMASQANSGQAYYVVDGNWDAETFFEELEAFPDPTVHDDQVDAMSGAFSMLAKQAIGRVNLGEHMNDDFLRENQWRPDVTPNLAPGDLASGMQGIMGGRIEDARRGEQELNRAVQRIWNVA